MLCLKEALFPFSEGQMIYHQTLDLVNHIRQFGPLRFTWAFPGERALCTIKNCGCKGGNIADITTMNRYCNLENTKFSDGYDFNINNIHHYQDLSGQKRFLQQGMNNKKCMKIKISNGKKIIEYNPNSFYMWNQQQDKS
jgi:hypothetical protein